MLALPDAAVLAFYLADGCAKILVPLLCFMGSGGPSTRSPAADEAATFLLLVLPTAYLACVILAHFTSVVLAYFHLAAAPTPDTAPTTTAAAAVSSAGPARFVVLLFTLVAACLLLIVVPFAAVSFFLGAGKRGAGRGDRSNVLS
ncbi:hypothetical protein ZWY2020_049981 [Hordeum vulgare]|nr:hypothetical protein ZWY2020_049981 [Hordeum vulgare]